VSIGSGGELRWSDEVDLCADALYMQITGKTPEEVFPGIAKATIHAWNICLMHASTCCFRESSVWPDRICGLEKRFWGVGHLEMSNCLIMRFE